MHYSTSAENAQVARTYTGLSMAALKRKDALRLRVFYTLKAVDDGRGWLTLSEAAKALADTCGVSTRRAKDWLKLDGEPWWRVEGGRIWLASWVTILTHFEAITDSSAVAIPLTDFRKIRRFKAACYATFLVPRNKVAVKRVQRGDQETLRVRRWKEPKRISRAVLTDLTGHTKSTLRQWEQVLDGRLKITPSINIPQGDPDPASFPDLNRDLGNHCWLQCKRCDYRVRPERRDVMLRHVKHVHRGNKRSFTVAWIGPNVYEAGFNRCGGKAAIRAARRACKHAAGERRAAVPQKHTYWLEEHGRKALSAGVSPVYVAQPQPAHLAGQNAYVFSFRAA